MGYLNKKSQLKKKLVYCNLYTNINSPHSSLKKKIKKNNLLFTRMLVNLVFTKISNAYQKKPWAAVSSSSIPSIAKSDIGIFTDF